MDTATTTTTRDDWVRVWDPLVRIGHWTLVATFFTAYLVEDDFLTVHVWAGYVLAGVVAFRLLWGLIGTRHARFTSFVRGPRAVLAYFTDSLHHRGPHYLGHNPAGGAMVIALLACLVVTAVSGIGLYAVEEGAGPLAGWLAEGRYEDAWEEVHEVFANLSLLLVILHVAGVGFSSLMHRENLVRSMITGRKRAE
ncbi:MAG: cytochrome b/b6 domain-containing protein [Pseudomonadales bacterium]